MLNFGMREHYMIVHHTYMPDGSGGFFWHHSKIMWRR